MKENSKSIEEVYSLDEFTYKNLEEINNQIFLGTTIDLVVNAAGGSIHGKFADLLPSSHEIQFDSNLKLVQMICFACWRNFINQGFGEFINISSLSGCYPYKNGSIYCAQKSGINTFLDVLKMEGVEHKIKVTNILSGNVYSDNRDTRDAKVRKAVKDMIFPKDIAELVMYIAGLPSKVTLNNIEISQFEPMVKFDGPFKT